MSVDAALSGIETLIDVKTKDLVPFSATVTLVSGGLVQLKRLGSGSASSQLYARLAGFELTVGDEVACISYLGSAFVLGKVQRTTPTVMTLSGGLVNSDWVNQEWWPYGQDACNQSGDVSSTASTATFQQAVSHAWTLPAVGTYDVIAFGSLQMTRSPAGQANLRLNINGSAGGTRIVNVDTAIYTGHMQWHAATGIAGGTSVPIKIEFKGNSGSGVTTSAIEPFLSPYYVRTS